MAEDELGHVMSKEANQNDTCSNNGRLGKPCIVCGETAYLTLEEESRVRYGLNIESKICDKCRQAILYMREQMQFLF